MTSLLDLILMTWRANGFTRIPRVSCRCVTNFIPLIFPIALHHFSNDHHAMSIQCLVCFQTHESFLVALQGPFTQADIMDWFEGNFFPPTLPIRSAKDPSTAPFRPLSAMLKIWAGAPIGPPGFIAMVR
jgi:hypothetical protein